MTAIAKGAAVLLAVTLAAQAHAEGEPIGFPEAYATGVHYATVNRGNIREEIFTSRAAIDAVTADQPIPPGTIITLLDYRDGTLFRYVAMEKRTGRWAFQWFNPDSRRSWTRTPTAASTATLRTPPTISCGRSTG